MGFAQHSPEGSSLPAMEAVHEECGELGLQHSRAGQTQSDFPHYSGQVSVVEKPRR